MAETMTAGVVRAYEKRVRVGPCLVQTDGDGTSLTIRFTYTPLGSRQDPVFVDRAVQE